LSPLLNPVTSPLRQSGDTPVFMRVVTVSPDCFGGKRDWEKNTCRI
jgi:hypothetical protein